MSDLDTVVSVLLNPVSLVIITVIATAVADYFVRMHFKRQDRRGEHSVKLKDEALIPWSQVQLSHNTVAQSEIFGEPGLTMSPETWQEPVCQWATAHPEKANPEVLAAWSLMKAALENEKGPVQKVKDTIRAEFAKAIDVEFQSRWQALPTWEESRRDAYYEDMIVYVVFTEVKAFSSNQGKLPQIFGLESQSIGSGAAYIGSMVVFNGIELARLQRQADASAEQWQRALNAAANSENVRQGMRAVMNQDLEATRQLALVKKGLRRTIQRIENGLPIEGKCELGF